MAIKSRAFTCAIKDEKQIDALKWKLQNGFAPDYYYILHDKDLKDDGSGELKDPHFHFVWGGYKNPLSLNSVADQLGIPANMIEPVHSMRAILRYLCHMDQPDKFQYDPKEVVSNRDYMVESREQDSSYFIDEFHDWQEVRAGIMTMEKFIMSHNISFTTLRK